MRSVWRDFNFIWKPSFCTINKNIYLLYFLRLFFIFVSLFSPFLSYLIYFHSPLVLSSFLSVSVAFLDFFLLAGTSTSMQWKTAWKQGSKHFGTYWFTYVTLFVYDWMQTPINDCLEISGTSSSWSPKSLSRPINLEPYISPFCVQPKTLACSSA